MAKTETHDGPTPAGGVRSQIFYQDADGNPAEKEEAVRMRIIELDDKGNVIRTTYGAIDRTDKEEQEG